MCNLLIIIAPFPSVSLCSVFLSMEVIVLSFCVTTTVKSKPVAAKKFLILSCKMEKKKNFCFSSCER